MEPVDIHTPVKMTQHNTMHPTPRDTWNEKITFDRLTKLRHNSLFFLVAQYNVENIQVGAS